MPEFPVARDSTLEAVTEPKEMDVATTMHEERFHDGEKVTVPLDDTSSVAIGTDPASGIDIAPMPDG